MNPRQVLFGRYLEMTGQELEESVMRSVDDNPALELLENSENEPVAGEKIYRGPFAGVPEGYTSRGEFFEPSESVVGVSLAEYVDNQLSELHESPRITTLAQYIAGNLDSNGYLTRSCEEMADDLTVMSGQDYTAGYLEEALRVLQSLDPPGIGASDLRECLMLQLLRQPEDTTRDIAIDILDSYFDLFIKKHFDKLESRLGIDREALKGAISRIRSLNPKPGNSLDSNTAGDRLAQISPDFYVEPGGNGRYSVTLLNRAPRLGIEESFRIDTPEFSRTQANPVGKEATLFIKRKNDEASELIRLLDMRAETLTDIIKAIVKLQHKFFDTEEISDIVPMVLRDIAALTGYSLSVISRATSGKYIATPGGIYPLKLFFNEKPREEAENITRGKLNEAISTLIAGEDPDNPLSDEAICSLLAEQGLDIARRTVAKYREKMKIPVARLRKKI